MLKDKITVVIPSIKFSENLVRAVRSSVDYGFNTIVIDNSGEGYIEKEIRAFDFDVEVCSTRRMLPMADNWNLAYSQVKSEYVLMLHDDDYIGIWKGNDFTVTGKDLYILKADLVTKGSSRLLHDYPKITAQHENDHHIAFLKTFPGVQRQVWKREAIKCKFVGSFYPIFDYHWFYNQMLNKPTISYVECLSIVINEHDEQATNKAKWNAPIVLTIVDILKTSMINPSFEKFQISKAALLHLMFNLKKHLIISLKRLFEK